MNKEATITWLIFLKLIIALLAIYWVLEIVRRFTPQILTRKSLSNKVESGLAKTIEVYKPMVIVFAIIGFVGINYKVNGVIILVAIILLFNYIKSYLNGVFFKINPLVEVGANISTGPFEGQIIKFLFFGVLIREVDSKRFINYSFIEKNGFSMNQHFNTPMRKLLYIVDVDNIANVIDLLFENPMVDYKNKPLVKKIPNENSYELQITLERGATIEALIEYLNQHNIKTSLS
jgi:hypothetical protein